MFSVFTNAWKVKDIRKRVLYVFVILVVYRIGCHIPLPGVDTTVLSSLLSGGNNDANILTIIAGGGYGSIFAMGIAPYITASIIMQLLTVAIPPLERLQKEGEEGRKKLGQYTRVASVALSLLQGIATVYSYSGRYGSDGQTLFHHPNMFTYIVATVVIVAGTIFIMWISELLTEKAIGNGSSFIIFANILSGIPQGVRVFAAFATGSIGSYFKIAFILLVFAAIIALVVGIQDGERRIPVQYSRKMVGRQSFGGQTSFIPIKVNIAGVMSIIFAISLLQTPSVIHQFFPNSAWLSTAVNFLNYRNWTGAIIYVLLIFAFTFFYTSFAINPIEMAKNLKDNGGFVPGIRPGKPTSDYISRTVDRLSWVGAMFYAIIALIPVIISAVFNINIGIGGTTLLIVVGVALELDKQLESQLLMRHYKGFLS